MKSPKKIFSTHEAKTHLSRLLKRVSQGEEIIIGKSNRPVALLIPYEPKPKKRKLGCDRDLIWVADDFDGPLPEEILKDFEK